MVDTLPGGTGHSGHQDSLLMDLAPSRIAQHLAVPAASCTRQPVAEKTGMAQQGALPMLAWQARNPHRLVWTVRHSAGLAMYPQPTTVAA